MNVYFATSQYVFLEAQPEQKLPFFFLLTNPTLSKGRGPEISRRGPLYLVPSLSSIKQVSQAICVNVIRLRKYGSLFSLLRGEHKLCEWEGVTAHPTVE
jgi:hypothetical protein